jgi:protein SCO1/2
LLPALLLAAGLAASPLQAQPSDDDPHAAHRAMMAAAANAANAANPSNTAVRRSMVNPVVPHLALVRDDGTKVSLDQELGDDRPVVLNFIFTTCTTICPMTSQVFSMLQRQLGDDRARVHLVSISIDPEQDTPARLREYAARFKAGAGWQHYTGTLQASIAVQQAFGVYLGDKSTHSPVTLVRGARGSNWVRLDGFATPDDLLAEVRGRLTAGR